MGGWGEFGAAMVVFLLSHAIPVRPPVRPWLVARMGLVPYLVCYSILSIGVLIWLVLAARYAPYIQVLPDWEGWRWAPVLIMPLVCWLAVAGLGTSNPLSFGGMKRGEFDRENPGVLGFTRHPLPMALALWSGAHLLAKGDLAHVILFGVFAGFAVMAMKMLDLRKQRLMGVGAWQDLACNTSLFNPAALRPRLWQVAAAIAIFVVLFHLHLPIIGFSPLP
ncbi:NnrU family protein [Rhodobacteraceae bacterium M382]|nr:NnrU family protein [Rhodobacteraceae bacterium M382]